MGLFSGILGSIGDYFLPGAGSMIGSAVGGMIDSDRSSKGVQEQNMANAAEAERTRGFNAEQAATNRFYQSYESDKNRGWLYDMSNSSYQRSMSDMAKAGLNPIMAASQGGASTPGSSAPSGSSASGVSARMENRSSQGLELEMANARLSNETKVAESQAKLNEASATRQLADAGLVPTTARSLESGIERTKEEVKRINEEILKIRVEVENDLDRGPNIRADTRVKLSTKWLVDAQRAVQVVEEKVKTGELSVQKANIALTNIRAKLHSLDVKGAENEESMENTSWGEFKHYLPSILSIPKGSK